MANKFNRVLEAWTKVVEQERTAHWWQLIETGKLTIPNYKGYLRETYHYTGVNPQTQAFATMFFDKEKRLTIKDFLNHAVDEISHDVMALNDLENLGEDRADIVKTRPAPQTMAFSALPFYSLLFRNPLSYLGHIFHLEFLATMKGEGLLKQLLKMGIPPAGLTFISEHAEIDPKHNELMKNYIEQLVGTEDDLEAVIYGAEIACKTYSLMVSEACILGAKDFD